MTERITWLLRDIGRARRQGPPGLAARQRDRLADQVAYARTHSPYYRDLFRRLPDRVETSECLPASTKPQLMERFDDWVTDPAVTLTEVRAFVDDPATIHQRFHGKYRVLTSSGSTGARGIYLLDQRDQAVTTALTLRFFLSILSAPDYVQVLARGARVAGLVAVGGHFASSLAIPQGNKLNRLYRIFPASTRLPDLVEQLNRFRPAILVGYASLIALLAGEQQAGRLHIDPALVMPGSEGLPLGGYDTLAEVFGAKVRNAYSACELLQPIGACRYQWLHVNSDWAILEPVDADYQPTPPGQPSHTVLISNLANRVQPFLRYDLGDSVRMRPDPCPCGSPFPAIRVQGRAADTLKLRTETGALVRLSPLTLGTVIDRTPHVEIYQIEQTSPATLRVRFHSVPGTHADEVWNTMHANITRLLHQQQLDNVEVQRASEPPQQSTSGKYRRIIPLSAGLVEDPSSPDQT